MISHASPSFLKKKRLASGTKTPAEIAASLRNAEVRKRNGLSVRALLETTEHFVRALFLVCTKTEHLPRQARDKQGKTLTKECRFLLLLQLTQIYRELLETRSFATAAEKQQAAARAKVSTHTRIFLNFSYVCPEPVLVKIMHFVYIHGSKARFSYHAPAETNFV